MGVSYNIEPGRAFHELLRKAVDFLLNFDGEGNITTL